MIVQAIGLLDDLDKELNTYAMRVREWYGWHFPEMSRIVADNITYAKTVLPTPPISISQRTSLPILNVVYAKGHARMESHIPMASIKAIPLASGGRDACLPEHCVRERAILMQRRLLVLPTFEQHPVYR